MARVVERGLGISKPWGECSHYDFVVEAAGRFLRVQVKSTAVKRRNGYVCAVRDCRGEPYESDAFDFLAVYVIPLEVWYLIPAELIAGQGSVAVYPGLKSAKYARYREAWELLEGRVGRIEGCAEGRRFVVEGAFVGMVAGMAVSG